MGDGASRRRGVAAALWAVALAAWVAVGEAGCAVGQCAADVDCNTGTFC